MQIKSLTKTNFTEIVNCFNEAFANYFVAINATETYLSQRWKGARINPDLSFGVFDKEKLVAFMFLGIDKHYGKWTAHNDGTGVIPAYRGNQLVDKMYEVAIPKLKAKGIEQCTLEVIQENERAIKVYTRIGFEKIRNVNCYGGNIIAKNTLIPDSIKITKTASPHWELYPDCFDFVPPWNNALSYIQRIPEDYTVLELFNNQQFVGFGATTETGSMPTFGIHPKFRGKGYGRILLENLAKISPNLRINNVEATSLKTIQFLEKMGMENSINQYEMLMVI